jgi:hypothetical protein
LLSLSYMQLQYIPVHPPTIKMLVDNHHPHITGTHQETRAHVANSHHHHKSGQDDTETETETTTEFAVDLDFRIDLAPSIIKDCARARVQ